MLAPPICCLTYSLICNIIQIKQEQVTVYHRSCDIPRDYFSDYRVLQWWYCKFLRWYFIYLRKKGNTTM